MASQKPNILISNIYKSRKIVLELMEIQGYNTSDYSNFSISEVNSMKQNNQLDMILEKKEKERVKKIYIRYYLGSSRPSNSQLRDMIEDLFILEEVLTKEDILYIIIKDEINDSLMNELKYIWENDGIFIIVESIKRLQFNILNHILVPKHKVMNEVDVIEIMKKYNITDKKLFPEISRFDPVARAICIRPGEVCHIIRPSKTAIHANYYRICWNV
jgi:DNA-directed RNA polymerase subunit H